MDNHAWNLSHGKRYLHPLPVRSVAGLCGGPQQKNARFLAPEFVRLEEEVGVLHRFCTHLLECQRRFSFYLPFFLLPSFAATILLASGTSSPT